MICRRLAVVLILLSLQLMLVDITASEASDIFIVFMEDDPVVTKFGGVDSNYNNVHAFSPETQQYIAYLTDRHNSLLEQTLDPGSYQKLYSYTHILNGFAVQLVNHEKMELLASATGVRHIQRSRQGKLQTTHSPEFLGLPEGAWHDAGGIEDAGEGVVIGVVDTGIDPTHPSFLDNTTKPYPPLPNFHGRCDVGPMFPSGSCNAKLLAARFFNKAGIASGRLNTSLDYPSPFDQDGHGTHTASTAAGNSGIQVVVNGVNFGNASGMAPRARLAVYRCMYRDGTGEEADVVAAIDQAVQDGVNIVSISLNYDVDEDNIATFMSAFDVAMLFAARAGVFTANSAGNSGSAEGTMQSNAPWVMTIGASTTDRIYPKGIVLGNNLTVNGSTLSSGTPQETMYPLIAAKNALTTNSSVHQSFPCQDSKFYDKSLIQGSIVLCTFSQSDPHVNTSVLLSVEKTANDLGSMGFVLDISNSSAGNMESFIVETPAVVIHYSDDSQAFFGYYNSVEHPIGRILGNIKGEFTTRAPLVVSFSSRGPAFANVSTGEPIDLLKPNILAPGKSIWAAYSTTVHEYPDEFEGARFASMSGTSMAAPHIAGVAALIKQKHPTWSPAAIASAMSTTASTKDNTGRRIVNDDFKPATPFDMGSGFVNAKEAMDPGLIFNAGFMDYVRFACGVRSREEVHKIMGRSCPNPTSGSKNLPTTDLNLPSIMVSALPHQPLLIARIVKNVANMSEKYTTRVKLERQGTQVEVTVSPPSFKLSPGASINLTITISVHHHQVQQQQHQERLDNFIASPLAPHGHHLRHRHYCFGAVKFHGDRGHSARIPLAIFPGRNPLPPSAS